MARPLLFALLAAVAVAVAVAGPPDYDTVHTLEDLARQVIMQQFHQEEQVRSDGDSGIKQMRHRTQGTRNYHGETHAGSLVAAVHNHADWERHVGSGEFEAVLNGVQFKTRHNDYQLHMPSRDSSNFLAVDEIPFPPVPPTVLAKRSVKSQVREMQKYFKAWQQGSTSRRDYRPYFKPVLCYLEGAWTKLTKKLVEPYISDRHFFDARTWPEMHSKIMYSSATGTKARMENFGYCPTKLYDNGKDIKKAQWIYRILCHPLKRNVPIDRLSPIDELANRVAYGNDFDDIYNLRSTRFRLNVYNKTSQRQGFVKWQFIDDLMSEIPGLNNYMTKTEIDNSFGITAREYNGDKKGNRKLNTAYYHRLSSDSLPDAMDNFFKTRGFSDENLFMAKTSQQEVLLSETRHCPLVDGKRERCEWYRQRWSVAIPLEIIYMTPLSTWNPYDITLRGHYLSEEGKKVTADGRDGLTAKRAYDGVNSAMYALTPRSFQMTGEVRPDPADTSTRAYVRVLDSGGTVRQVRYSGIRVVMPDIRNVGFVRQRYPIMPVYADGNPIMKELQALKDTLAGLISPRECATCR